MWQYYLGISITMLEKFMFPRTDAIRLIGTFINLNNRNYSRIIKYPAARLVLNLGC